ncbi:MAG: hypothetical protein PHS41_03070 [Victivallaceae bacterium]|nr:hypothetical protein [Victivallaceae bacterium]
MKETIRNYLQRYYTLGVFLLPVAIFALIAYGFVLASAVDIPFCDEWFVMEELPAKPSLGYFFAPHNEHCIVFTRVMYAALHRCGLWNVPLHLMLNYLQYLAMIAMLVVVYRPWFDKKPYLALLLLPMFSCLLRDNLMWPFMVQMTQMIFFALVGIYFGFLRRDTPGDFACFAGALICSALSMSFTFAAAILGCFIVAKFYFRADSDRRQRIGASAAAAAVAAVIALMLLREPRGAFDGMLLPWDRHFYEILLDHFGRGVPKYLAPVFVTAVVGFGFFAGLLVLSPQRQKNRSFQAVTALTLAVLGTTFLIFVKRGGIGYRHLESIFIILPGLAIIFSEIPWKWPRRIIYWGFLALQLLYWPPRLELRENFNKWKMERLADKRCFDAFLQSGDLRNLDGIIFSAKPTHKPKMPPILAGEWQFVKHKGELK